MRKRWWMTAAMTLITASAWAQVAPAPAASTVKELPAMVVSGVLPGPGLWKVSKGDHVLWILGTLTPLPKKMQWQSQQVTTTVEASQEVLRPPAVEVSAKTGFFGTLFLLPRLIGIRDLPDGKRLVDVLPPAEYARWSTLKAQYLPHNHSVERYRPMFAAMKLYTKAVESADLSDKDVAQKLVYKLAKDNHIAVVDTGYRFTITQPKQALEEFKHGQMDDAACLTLVMDRVEHGLPAMQAMANAWATGDIDTLMKRPSDNAGRTCAEALDGTDFARQQGIKDLPGKMRQSWIAAAVQALAKNRSTFALMPIGDLAGEDGYLALLKSKGYTVQSPDDEDAPAAAGSAPAPATSVVR